MAQSLDIARAGGSDKAPYRSGAGRTLLTFKMDGGDGRSAVMGQGQRNVHDPESPGYVQSATGKVEGGSLTGLAADLDFSPGDAVLDAGTEGFGSGLLGGEAGGEAFGGVAALEAAVGNFGWGEDTVEEAISEALDGSGNSVNLDHVNSGADEHACNLNDFEGIRNPIAVCGEQSGVGRGKDSYIAQDEVPKYHQAKPPRPCNLTPCRLI
jgi:hypothetical protein